MSVSTWWVETEGGGVRPATMGEAAQLYETPGGNDRRRVAQDDVGGHRISTIFLAIDHGFSPDPNAAPVLYETMIFGRGDYGNDQFQRRYRTRAEALAGHREIVRRLAAGESLEGLP